MNIGEKGKPQTDMYAVFMPFCAYAVIRAVWGFLHLKEVDSYGELLNSRLHKLKIGIIILTKVNILFKNS